MGKAISSIADVVAPIASVIPGGQGVAAIAGGVGSLAGALDSQNAQNQLGQASQAAMNNASQFGNLLQGNLQTATNEYNQQYSQLLNPLMTQLQGLNQGTAGNTSQLAQMLSQAGLDPSVIAKLTGVDANGLTQTDLSNLTNTSGTNLAQAQPGASSYLNNEVNNGINSQFAGNAQNQIQQGLQQQIADARAQAQPGQNVNALTKDLRYQALQNQTNLAGNLAGQSQTFSNSALANLLQNAGNLDAQKAGMLNEAQTTGNAYNQQQLQNSTASYGVGTNVLDMMQKLLGSGQSFLEGTYSPSVSAMNSYATISNNIANQAAAAGQQTQNAFQTFGDSLNNMKSTFGWGQPGSTSSSTTADPGYNVNGIYGNVPANPTTPLPTTSTSSPGGYNTNGIWSMDGSSPSAPTPSVQNYTPQLYTNPGSNNAVQNYQYQGLNMAGNGSNNQGWGVA